MWGGGEAFASIPVSLFVKNRADFFVVVGTVCDATCDSRRVTQFPGLRRLDLGGLDCINDNTLKAIASTLSLTHIDLSRLVTPRSTNYDF